MTNFATFIDTGNDKAPIAQRGKAKQKRSDLRLVGLGLVVTRDGGIPLISHAYPGDRPDVTQFSAVIDQLRDPVPAVWPDRRASADGGLSTPGRTPRHNLATWSSAGLRLRRVGARPSDYPRPARPARHAYRRSTRTATRRADRVRHHRHRATARPAARCSTHSPELHATQPAGSTRPWPRPPQA